VAAAGGLAAADVAEDEAAGGHETGRLGESAAPGTMRLTSSSQFTMKYTLK
jgi:hypothetical protein